MPPHLEKKAMEVWKSVEAARARGEGRHEPGALEMSSSGYVGHEKAPLGEKERLPADVAERIMDEHRLHEGLSEEAATMVAQMLRSAGTYERVLEIVGYTKQLKPAKG